MNSLYMCIQSVKYSVLFIFVLVVLWMLLLVVVILSLSAKTAGEF